MAKQKSPAFQFYPQDFLADVNVQVMTAEERGAYITLLCHEWIEGGLPIDDDKLAMLSGARERWPEIRDRVMACFKKSGSKASKWINPRLRRERKAQRERRAKRAKSGKEGASARWGKSLQDEEGNGKCHAGAMAKGMANDGSSSSSSSSIIKEIDSSPPTPPPGDGLSSCERQELSFSPHYQQALDAWREERGKVGLTFVADPQTKEGARILAAMIEDKQADLKAVQKAMANLLANEEARSTYTLRGLANNLSTWIDGGGKNGGKTSGGKSRRGGQQNQGENLERGAKAFEGL